MWPEQVKHVSSHNDHVTIASKHSMVANFHFHVHFHLLLRLSLIDILPLLPAPHW